MSKKIKDIIARGNEVITYEIELSCEINKYGAVIPVGCNHGLRSSKKDTLFLNDYPDMEKLMIIWLGRYYSYPKIKNARKD